jgi:aconitase A
VYPLLLIGFGAVRTEMQELGGDPNPINPLSQIDLNIAHSI